MDTTSGSIGVRLELPIPLPREVLFNLLDYEDRVVKDLIRKGFISKVIKAFVVDRSVKLFNNRGVINSVIEVYPGEHRKVIVKVSAHFDRIDNKVSIYSVNYFARKELLP